jgi:hypothetical protein
MCPRSTLCGQYGPNLVLGSLYPDKTLSGGVDIASLPRFTGLVRLSARLDDHYLLSDDPRNATTIGTMDERKMSRPYDNFSNRGGWYSVPRLPTCSEMDGRPASQRTAFPW